LPDTNLIRGTTDDRRDHEPARLVEKTPDADLLRQMIGFAAHRLMELEIEGLAGAAYGEKSPERLAQRNGFGDRDWETRAGTVESRITHSGEGDHLFRRMVTTCSRPW
jgi:transposase-like protein